MRALLIEAQRLHRLVGNLLDLTRLTSGPVQLKHEWVALDELIGSVLNRLRDALAGRDVSVEVPPQLPLIRCDEVLIEQVLFNLVENAQKHTPAGTPIRIAVRAWPALFEVTVSDRGPGLPSGDEQRVFEKFHRGHAEAAQSGFGLGLTICRTIIEAHGGTITAPLVGRWRRFRFNLPRQRVSAVTATRTTVLVIEDDPQIQRFLAAALESHNYAPEFSGDGAEGLRLATLHQPDIVILDLGLPDISVSTSSCTAQVVRGRFWCYRRGVRRRTRSAPWIWARMII